MKKIFTFTFGLLASLAMMAEPFAVRVNGSQDYAAAKVGEADAQGRTQYAAMSVPLKAGDKLTCFDAGGDGGKGVAWNIGVIDQYGAYQSFSTGNDALTCNKEGSYNIYIKMKMNDDMWYIEEANGGGGGNPGGGENPGGGGVAGNPRYYYKGNIDGEDVEPTDSRLFEHGVAEIEFSQKAALFVLYQVDGAEGVQYMTSAWSNEPVAQATLSVNGGGKYEKWNCPVGTTKLYLYDNGDGTLEISNKEIPGKKLADPQPSQAIEHTLVTEKAHKVIIDGQLRIVRGDKMYDATGREL